MAAPLKNLSAQEIEKAVQDVLCALHGQLVSVKVGELKFDQMQSRTDIALSVWSESGDDLLGGFQADFATE